MSAARIAAQDDRRTWGLATTIAAAAHLAAALALFGWARPMPPRPPEPVMLVELPAGDLPAAAPVSQPAATPQSPQPATVQSITAPLAAPPAPRSVPPAPVTLPVATPLLPDRQAASAPAQPAATPVQAAVSPAGAGSGTGPATGADPRARAAEIDYFALISAYLNRRKTYPVEARRARQEGIVVVRFTVDREGGVSGTAIKRGSGHDLLDQATLALLERVAPLPRMPAAMHRQAVTVALPIAYTLKTS